MKIFFRKCNILLHLVVILVPFLLTVKLIIFEAWSLRELQNFFIQTSPRYKLCLFSTLSKSPYSWHWIPDRNMFTYSCYWRFFWVVCTSIYFFNQRFKVSINNVCHFIWLNLLFISDGIAISSSIFLQSSVFDGYFIPSQL